MISEAGPSAARSSNAAGTARILQPAREAAGRKEGWHPRPSSDLGETPAMRPQQGKPERVTHSIRTGFLPSGRGGKRLGAPSRSDCPLEQQTSLSLSTRKLQRFVVQGMLSGLVLGEMGEAVTPLYPQSDSQTRGQRQLLGNRRRGYNGQPGGALQTDSFGADNRRSASGKR